MTKKQKALLKWILGLLLTLVTIIGGIKTIFYSDKTTTEPKIKINRKDHIIIDGNGNDNTIIDGNGNKVERNSYIINNNRSDTQNKKNKTDYQVIGTSNNKFLNFLKKSQKINIVPNSVNVIEITFTGEISLLNQNSDTYIYSGGNVLLKVDNLNCHEFENLKISDMKPNSKNTIITEIQKNIDNYINNDPKLFLNKITKCINQY
jgi:lipopolysaccharide export LptBFGC system permease protein LptF